MSCGDRGEGGVKKFYRPPTVCCFVEASGGSIDLVGYLAVNLLGENGDDAAAVGALHSWIVCHIEMACDMWR